MKLLISSLLLLFYFYFLLFNENGFLKNNKTETKIILLKDKIKSIEIENQNLTQKKELLVSDTSYLSEERDLWNKISEQGSVLKFEKIKDDSLETIKSTPLYFYDFKMLIENLNFFTIFLFILFFILIIVFYKWFSNLNLNKSDLRNKYEY